MVLLNGSAETITDRLQMNGCFMLETRHKCGSQIQCSCSPCGKALNEVNCQMSDEM